MAPTRRSRRAKAAEPEPEPEPEPQVESDPEAEQEDDEEQEQEQEQEGEEQEQEENGEEQQNGGEEEELVKLQFDEELTWRPGKPIPVGTLLPRLERLFDEMNDMDQDTADKESLVDVAHALVQRNLIQHKDSSIKATVAACLVEILRLCAPDAPYTEDQLKMLFSVLINNILPLLKDPGHAYNSRHKHVLASLAEVKSILLLHDLNGADELLQNLFTTCFDCVSAPTLLNSEGDAPADIEAQMTEMLTFLVDESPTGLPVKVVDAVIAQFLRPSAFKSTHGSENNGTLADHVPKKEPPAYVMAKMICTYNPERMARYISQYFADVIMDASAKFTKSNGHKQGGEEPEGEHAHAGLSDKELKSLQRAHSLIREMWRAAPAVLQNVVPQVEAELGADDVLLRQIATETFGDMIAGIGVAGPPPPPNYDPCQYPPPRLMEEPSDDPSGNPFTTPMSSQSFSQTYPTAYHAFLGRKIDKSPLIRAAWTTAAGYILSTAAGGLGLSREDDSSLIQAIGEKLNDTDEKVRLAAVKVFELFSFRDIVTKLGPNGGVDKEGSVLASLADRCRDKRPAVRVEAMVVLGKLWAIAAGELAAGQEPLVNCLSGIPSRIISVFYANDPDLYVLLDRVLFECMVPLGYPPRKSKGGKGSSQNQSGASGASGAFDPDKIRAERMLQLAKSLNEPAKKAFMAMQSRQPQFAKVVETFVKQCELFNGGTMDDNEKKIKENLVKAVNYLAKFFPDSHQFGTNLHKFAKANDRRNYQLIKFATGTESDFKTVHGAIKELIKRIQAGQSPALLDSILPLLYRSSCLMFNKSYLPTILDCSKSDKDGLGAISHEILGEISGRNPDIFKTHVGELCKSLVEQAPAERKPNDASVIDILKACSSYARKFPEEIPQDKAFSQALLNYACFGSPPKAAKYAVNIMLARKDDRGMVHATSLVQRVMKNWKYDAPHFLNKLAAVSQLELLAPKVTFDHDQDILDMTVQKILLQVRTDAKPDNPAWVEDGDMDEEIQAKCICLKILVNRLRAADDAGEAKEKAKAVFKLLRNLIAKDGEICRVKDTPRHHKARLVLLASQLTLKICTIQHLDDMLTPNDFNMLACVSQRREAAVRHRFVEKLQKYLVQGKLRPRFYTIIFLTAFEPSPAVKQRLETWIRSRAQHYRAKSNKQIMEATTPRLISLLAHHPDYSTDTENLVDHAKYILYFVSNVATEDNLGIIAKYAERVKQTRDAIDPSKSENIYLMCDLTQTVLRKWQEKKGWAFQTYSGKIGLPVGLYTHLQSHDEAQKISEKNYLPDDVDEKLDALFKSVDKKKKRKSMDERHDPPAKKVKMPIRKDKPGTSKPKTPKPAQPKKKKRASKPGRSSPPAESSADRRRSGRRHGVSKYTERDSSEDDEEMLEGVAEWDYYDDKGREVSLDRDDGSEDDAAAAGGGSGSDLSEAPDSEEEESPFKKKAAAPKTRAKPPARKPAAARKGRSAKKVYDMDVDEDDE